jgi:hypothetical protein
MEKYFGGFSTIDGLDEFLDSHYKDGKYVTEPKPELWPTDDEVVFAAYGQGNYQGSALVLFKRDGNLYEANGGHCSCRGLEGQWSPEETSWEALVLRQLDNYEYDQDTIDAFNALVQAGIRGEV